jgi:starch phosphorylase
VARTINADPRTEGRLKVVFVPNYGVSVAMMIIPAAELSEQISTAGTEASGTGNMKLALNGALTIGTDDGANIEIREAVGDENVFMFGLSAEEVRQRRAEGYRPRDIFAESPELQRVIDQISSGYFSPHEPACFAPLVQSLLDYGDHYMLVADYASYVAAQERVDALYADRAAWTSASIRTISAMGPFSSDHTIMGYAEQVWRVQPIGF